MDWGLPLYESGRSTLFFSLALCNYDFFSDLLYFTVKVADGGYQHPSLTVVAFATFFAPAIACALRNDFFRQFVSEGTYFGQFVSAGNVNKNIKLLFGEDTWIFSSLPKALAFFGLLSLSFFVLLGTLVLGVNLKLFALDRFLRFYRKFLLWNGAERSSEAQEEDKGKDKEEDKAQVVALNEAFFFELALESVPQICVVIINESLTPGQWSSIAIISLAGSIFSALASSGSLLLVYTRRRALRRPCKYP